MNISMCLYVQQASISPSIKKFQETTRPGPGKERIHYGKAEDSKIAYELTHGIKTRPSLVVCAIYSLRRIS